MVLSEELLIALHSTTPFHLALCLKLLLVQTAFYGDIYSCKPPCKMANISLGAYVSK